MNAVIFDMDGLMFDTEAVFIKAWDYAGEAMGIGKAGYMNLKTLGMSITMSKAIWLAEFGADFDLEALRTHTKRFLASYYEENKVPVKTGLYVLLDYLKSAGYQLAVASSSPRWEVEKHLADAGVRDYFDAVVCGDMAVKTKPDPELYLLACCLLKEAPENCYALEDSKNGLLSAYRAGCKPIMVPDLWQPDAETEKILLARLDSLLEVKEYLDRLAN